jgi:hypothetical protein
LTATLSPGWTRVTRAADALDHARHLVPGDQRLAHREGADAGMLEVVQVRPADAAGAQAHLDLVRGQLDGQGGFDAQVARAMDAADKGHAGALVLRRRGAPRGACQLAVNRSCDRDRCRLIAGARRRRRGRDGVDHGLVLGDGQLPAVAVLEVAAQLREQRVVALVVELGDDACQHRVARGFDDAHVEQAVAHRGQLPLVDLGLHHAHARRAAHAAARPSWWRPRGPPVHIR